MSGLKHRTAFECGMGGSNSLDETGHHPLYFWPECQAKICWATSVGPSDRFENLAQFCEQNGLVEEARYFESARSKSGSLDF